MKRLFAVVFAALMGARRGWKRMTVRASPPTVSSA